METILPHTGHFSQSIASPNMSSKQKTALITGACGGLGKAIAQRFLADGANVIVCDVNQKLIAEFKENVSSAYPESTLVKECDITSQAAVTELFKEGIAKFGQIDSVVNCAGIMDKFDPVGDLDIGLFERVMAVNVKAPIMISGLAVNHFIEKKIKGSIVNIASIAGIRGWSAGAAYTASKHALLGITKNTAAFYGATGPGKHGIRCNAIMPGYMQTNIGDSMKSGYNELGMKAQMTTCKFTLPLVLRGTLICCEY